RQIFVLVLREVDGDAEQPGAELRITTKILDTTEDLDENFLAKVARILGAPEHTEGQTIHLGLIGQNQLIEVRLVPLAEKLDQARFGMSLTGKHLGLNFRQLEAS